MFGMTAKLALWCVPHSAVDGVQAMAKSMNKTSCILLCVYYVLKYSQGFIQGEGDGGLPPTFESAQVL